MGKPFSDVSRVGRLVLRPAEGKVFKRCKGRQSRDWSGKRLCSRLPTPWGLLVVCFAVPGARPWRGVCVIFVIRPASFVYHPPTHSTRGLIYKHHTPVLAFHSTSTTVNHPTPIQSNRQARF